LENDAANANEEEKIAEKEGEKELAQEEKKIANEDNKDIKKDEK